MPNQIDIEIPENCNKSRLDIALVNLLLIDPKPSRSQISKWIDSGAVSVNGELVLKPAYLVETEDLINIIIPSSESLEIVPDASIPLEIVFEDSDLLVINKQAGLVVHPGAGNWSGTLVNALAAYLGKDFFNDSLRPGIVHRLDKDTSGLMVIAKSQLALQSLTDQFLPPRKISRKYLAIVTGNMKDQSGTIDLPIARDLKDRKKMATSSSGKKAITHWEVCENYSCGAALLKLTLETGRTHQIRVHLQSMKAPIIGDPVYGVAIGSLPNKIRKTCQDFQRQALHACSLEFYHPRNNLKSSFETNIPDDMQNLLNKLKQIA